jgi:putative transposase
MPWNIKELLGQRLRLVKLAIKAQQSLAELGRIFGISRRTAYKWIGRFEEGGLRALGDRSRRPQYFPTGIPAAWIERIRRLRQRHRRWGGKKIGAVLAQRHGRRGLPAVRTIARCLERLNLVKRRRRRSPKGPPLPRPPVTKPHRNNVVWTVDFKGWFRTGDGQRVDPLTIRDLFSRYILGIALLRDQQWWRAQGVFIRVFQRYGLPKVIRVDNGGPFGSVGPVGLTRLSAWWTALGIRVEFIAPGHPEQNGAHEQMHRVLKAEATQPPSSNRRAQQRRINLWVAQYNQERPHEGLQQKRPSQVYRPGRRQQAARQPVVNYRVAWEARKVRSNGQIKWQGRRRFIGEAFVGYRIGLKRKRLGRWQVNFAGLMVGELRASDAGGLRPTAYVPQHPTIPKKKV